MGTGTWVRVPVNGFVYFWKEVKVSWRGVMMPCMIPIMVVIPMVSNIRKKRNDQKTDPGINDMASMKARKAKFVFYLTC